MCKTYTNKHRRWMTETRTIHRKISLTDRREESERDLFLLFDSFKSLYKINTICLERLLLPRHSLTLILICYMKIFHLVFSNTRVKCIIIYYGCTYFRVKIIPNVYLDIHLFSFYMYLCILLFLNDM